MPIEEVRSVVPPQLEVDSQDGRAWISLVPMRVQGAHFRDVEPIPGLDHFCEINLRTYVKLGDERGVYFITIDCSDSIADWLGQKLFGVPTYRLPVLAGGEPFP